MVCYPFLPFPVSDCHQERKGAVRILGFQDIRHWWPSARFQRQVRRALASTVSVPPPARAFLDGSGVVVVPFDPVDAALSAAAIRDFCRGLEHPVRLAGPPGSLRWIADVRATPIEIPETLGERSFPDWLEYHRADRADWCLLATVRPTPVEEACFSWLGSGARFAPFGVCRSNPANIQIRTDPESSLDARMRRFMRVLQPCLPDLGVAPRSNPSGPILLELPPDLPEKGRRTRQWIHRIQAMVATRPLLLAHSEALPGIVRDLVCTLGPRVALVNLSSAPDVLELAHRAGRWVGARTPASALASLEGCRVHLLGPSDASRDFPHSERLTVSGKIDELDPREVE